MFSRIAPRYDLMNRLMTAGMDIRLRSFVIRKTHLPPNGKLLDIGSGTGDLALEARRQFPSGKIIAADFTLNMMRIGQKRSGNSIPFSAADALKIPCAANSFDAVVSGFLLRNVVDLEVCLREQMRVLKPGGWFVSLDTTKPGKSFLSPMIRFYMNRVIPFLGGLLTGERSAYVYLPESTTNFLRADDLVGKLGQTGFTEIQYKKAMFNTTAIHWAKKP